MPVDDFEAFCKCGRALKFDIYSGKHGRYVIVEPCPDCTKDATLDGYTRGYADGEKSERDA